MIKEDYEYLMSDSYSILLPEDIEKFEMYPFLSTHFHVHYSYESLTFIVSDDGSNKIVKKFNKNDKDYKSSLYNLPAQITYNYHGSPMLILYRHADTHGLPHKSIHNYSVNNVLIDSKFYWYDDNEILLNPKLNKFFNQFFMEKMFDVTLDYDGSPVMNFVINAVLHDETDKLIKAFKILDITSLDHINQSYSELLAMVQI